MSHAGAHAGEPPSATRPLARAKAWLRRFLGWPRSVWARFPRAVLVTILGAVFTVLIVPAVTKQWDDRQKARELKAGLVENINVAAVSAISDSLALSSPRPEEIVNRWLLASGVIEARIRAYFPPHLLADWRDFRELLRAFPQLAAWYDSRPNDYELATLSVLELPISQARRDELVDQLNSPDRSDRVGGMLILSHLLLDQVDRLETDLLAVDPDGFSTSRGDLIRDLVP